MTEELKPQPETQPEGQVTENTDTGAKSAEDMVKELTEQNAKTAKELEDANKRVQEKESFIGKQGSELGELRKLREDMDKLKADSSGTKNELVDKMKSKLMKERGMDEETAKYNATLLVEDGGEIVDNKMKQRSEQDFIDMVEDSLEDGVIDRKTFDENEAEIIAEFKSRKLTPTARGNFRIFKKVAKEVIQKKADVLKEENNKESEEKRDGMIAGTTQPQSKRKQEEVEAEKKETDSILNAGSNRNNTFF